MGYIAKLRRGIYTINLNEGRYALDVSFVPPTTAEAPVLGGASSANRYGSRLIGVTASEAEVSVPLNIRGSSSAEVERAIDDLNLFLSLAGDEAEPTWFEFKPDDNVRLESILGQDGTKRLEVLYGRAGKPAGYGIGVLRNYNLPDVELELVVKPYAKGRRSRWAQAKGGISEDIIGMPMGQSRGLQIPEGDASEGNWFTNPIFSNSTWNSGWTDGSGMVSSKNIDPEYVIFGTVSARLASSSDITGTFTTSINVGDTDAYVMSCYAVRKDRAAINSSNCQLYWNGSGLTTTFTLIDNGIYRLTASVTGVIGSASAGILVKKDNVLYVDGFQLEKRTYVTPLMCGDFLGHAWTSAGHGSRSTRTAPYVRYPEAGLFDTYAYTIRIGWVAPRANTAYTDDFYIFQASDSIYFRLFYEDLTDLWYFMDGMCTASAFDAGDQLVFHVVCNEDDYSLYINGSLICTREGGGFISPPVSGYLYLGSDANPDNYAGGRFNDFVIFNGALTAAEVLADYNNISPVLADGQQISPVLYHWTKDGDEQVDNHTDGAGAYNNYCVIGGVAGDAPAEVDMKLTTAGMNAADVYLGRLDIPYNRYIDPIWMVYEGSPDAVTVTTSDSTLATISVDDDEFLMIAGRKLAVMVRGDEDGSNNISLRTGIDPGGGYYYTTYLASDWIASGTATSIDLSPELFAMPDEEFYRLLGITRSMSVRVQGKRSTGSSIFKLHSAQFLPYPVTRFVNLSGAAIEAVILYTNGRAYELNGSALNYGYRADGTTIELIPGRYNLWITFLGKERVLSEPADTITYEGYVTPRWKVQ